jgi:predicted DNA-binding transcriptional regulator AlpA
MTERSTAQVARKIGVGRDTLHRWLHRGLTAPRKQRIGGVSVRMWSAEDLKRAREYKDEHYRKGRGRKKAQKKSGNR